MTYRNFYLQAMSAADQIQSGEYQKVRAEKTQDMVTRQDSTLVRRPEKKTEEKEYTFNDTLLEYMRIANLAGEDFGEGTGSNLETGEDPAWVKDTSTEGVSLSSKDVNLGQVAIGIREAAEELGIDPVDLATTISLLMAKLGSEFFSTKSTIVVREVAPPSLSSLAILKLEKTPLGLKIQAQRVYPLALRM